MQAAYCKCKVPLRVAHIVAFTLCRETKAWLEVILLLNGSIPMGTSLQTKQSLNTSDQKKLQFVTVAAMQVVTQLTKQCAILRLSLEVLVSLITVGGRRLAGDWFTSRWYQTDVDLWQTCRSPLLQSPNSQSGIGHYTCNQFCATVCS